MSALNVKPVKRETFDLDAMENLLIHDGVGKSEKSLLRAYKKARENGNEVQVVYEHGKKYAAGRIYPQKCRGLQTMPSGIRACLAQKYYWDIDMANSQPSLMVAKCKEFGWPCAKLEEYTLNRSAKLDEVMLALGCDRSAAKQFCLTILFGATGYKNVQQYYTDLMCEISTISTLCYDKFPEIAKHCTKENNPKASCLAHWIQGEEATIMNFIDIFLISKGRALDVNIHDGGLVRKLEGETTFPVDTLRDIEAAVFEKFGITIGMEVKPLIHSYTFNTTDTYIPSNIQINDRWAAEQFVNLCGNSMRRHAGEIYVLKDETWTKDPNDVKAKVFEFPQLVFKQIDRAPFDYHGNNRNVAAMLLNLPILAKQQTIPFQFHYEFAEATESDEVVPCFLELLDIVSNDNSEVRDYIIKWLSHALQKPEELPGVALVISGPKGCGKDTPFDFLGQHVFGNRYYSNYDKTIKLFEKHDTQRMGRILIKVEEADRRTCLENANALKSMITSPSLTFEPKNKGEVVIPNNARMVMTLNTGVPVDMSQGERRFMITNCSGRHIGDGNYWERVRSILFNDGAGKQVADWLMAQDIDDFQVRKYPVCAYHAELLETLKSPEILFIEDWNGNVLTATELYDKYIEFCIRNNYPRCQNSLSFGNKLIVPVRDGILLKKRSNSSVIYKKP